MRETRQEGRRKFGLLGARGSLELGLRLLQANSTPGFSGETEILEFLAGLPTPEEIIKLRPSDILQARIEELLDKNRSHELTPAEQQEWERYQLLEHIIRLAKAKALGRLRSE